MIKTSRLLLFQSSFSPLGEKARMRGCVVFLFLAVFFAGCQTFSKGPETSVFSAQTSQGMKYRILTFPGMPPERKFPVIVALHGAGMNSDAYMAAWEKEAARKHFMIVTPDWQNRDFQSLAKAVDEILRIYPVDFKRIYLSGLSAGGVMGTRLVRRNPFQWKGLVWIAFSTQDLGTPEISPQGFPPILIRHGSLDPFPAGQVQKDSEKLKAHGFRVTWIEDAKAGHEHKPEWTKPILDWLEALIPAPGKNS